MSMVAGAKHSGQEFFPHAESMVVPGTPFRKGYKITCSQCGVDDKYYRGTTKTMPPDVIAARFAGRGWDVSKGRRDKDVCPSCNPRYRERGQKVVANEPVAVQGEILMEAPKQPAPEGVVVQLSSPPEMTREDRRIIFARLNDVYLDEKTGYGDGWTDHRVAEDLSVPRRWVEIVREEHFGPERSNSEIREALAAAHKLVAEARDLGRRAQDIRDAFNGDLKLLLEMATDIKKTLERIQKKVGL